MKCGQSIPDGSKICPNCGFELPNESDNDISMLSNNSSNYLPNTPEFDPKKPKNPQRKPKSFFSLLKSAIAGLLAALIIITLAMLPTSNDYSGCLSMLILFGIPEIILLVNICTENKRYQAAKDRQAAIISEDYKIKMGEAERKALEIIREAETSADDIKQKYINQSEALQDKVKDLKKEQKELENKISELNNDYKYQITAFSIDETITSEEYKNQLALLTLEEKGLIKDNKDIEILDSSINKKLQNNDIKQITRSFNNETAVIISEVTAKNIESKRTKLMRSFDALNKIFKTDGVAISKTLLELKLKMLNAKYAYEYQKEQERLQQKAIREQMLEEEKVRREIEREKAKIEKEETQFKNEISKLMAYMQKSSDIEKQLYVDKIKELEEKLKAVEKDKNNVLDREQNTRAGFVYIISNIGSFGENIYKIGMTRRLEPMDRINELSSASVPFEFDVHAMIFSEDAPALENTLHNIFADKRVNKVNTRKEFFNVSLDEIEKAVKENFNATVQFTKVAEAYQYRESLKLKEQLTTV